MAARLGRSRPAPIETEAVEVETASAADLIEDEGAPMGPNDGEVVVETGMEMEPARHVPSTQTAETEEEPVGELPALAQLVARIPQEALATMDELFRAKFVGVKRIPAARLKKS